MDPFLPCKHLLCKSSVLCVPQYWRRVYSAAPLLAAASPWWQVLTVRGVAHAASIVCSIYVRTKQGRKKKSIVQQRKETKKSRSRSVTRKIHQPIALNARAHEHTRVLRHSIIFVHAYNKVIDAKYRICKIELFSKDIIRRRFKMGCCPWQTKVITK